MCFTGVAIDSLSQVNRSRHWCSVSVVKLCRQNHQSIPTVWEKFRCRTENQVHAAHSVAFTCNYIKLLVTTYLFVYKIYFHVVF